MVDCIVTVILMIQRKVALWGTGGIGGLNDGLVAVGQKMSAVLAYEGTTHPHTVSSRSVQEQAWSVIDTFRRQFGVTPLIHDQMPFDPARMRTRALNDVCVCLFFHYVGTVIVVCYPVVLFV